MFSLLNIKRLFLALIFIYFVSMMIVMGNGHSFLGRYLSSLFIPVANSIGLNTTWNFFSPDPANTMYFRYDVIFEDEYGNTTGDSVEEFFPRSKDQGGDFRLDLRRYSYAMRWLAVDMDRVRLFFIPLVCREHPKAKKVQIELIVKPIPALEKVMTLKNEEFESLLNDEEIGRSTYDCI
jgi:hypothetical protein